MLKMILAFAAGLYLGVQYPQPIKNFYADILNKGFSETVKDQGKRFEDHARDKMREKAQAVMSGTGETDQQENRR